MEIKLNLASKPYLNRQTVRLWLLLACTLLMLVLLLNCLYGFQNYRQMQLFESRLQEMKGQVSGVQNGATGYTPEGYAEVRSEVDLANDIIASDQFRWTHLLSRFEELVPADVSLRTIQPDFKSHALQISGNARDISAMTQFIDNLLSSDDFNQAYLKSHGEVESEQGGMVQMQIGFSLVIREAF
jgi:hypothetical protein